MIKRSAILLLLLLTSWKGWGATTRYIDRSATGANNGTSWIDAWTNIYSCHRESNLVTAGDTVCVKGGDYSGTAAQLKLQGGSAGNWTKYYFTNGQVKLYCGISMWAFTEIDAAAAPNYETNILNSTYAVPRITNNCNLWLWRHTNWYNVGSGGRSFWIWSAPTKIRWVHITGTTNRYADVPPEYTKSDSASEVFYESDFDQSVSNELAYIWIDQSSGHGAGAAVAIGSGGTNFGMFSVHHSLFENNGSDLCNFTAGVDYHHNVIRKRQGLGAQGCNDTFTIGGSCAYNRIYDNLIEPADNTLYYLWGSVSNIHDFYFYNNILVPVAAGYQMQANQGGGVQEQDLSSYVVITNLTHSGTTATAKCSSAYNPNNVYTVAFLQVTDPAKTGDDTNYFGAYTITPVDAMTFTYVMPRAPASDFIGTNANFTCWMSFSNYCFTTNILFAQNTWIGTTNDGAGGLLHFISKNNMAAGFKFLAGSYVVKNNLIVDIDTVPHAPQGPFGFHAGQMAETGFNNLGYGFVYDSSSIVLDYNLFDAYTAGNLTAAGWGQSGAVAQTLVDSNDIARVMGYTHNLSLTNSSLLVDPDNFDYRPASAAVNMGEDLSAWTSLAPDIDKDIYGRQRGLSGAWSAGAIEYTNTGLVLRLTFARDDGWETNHVITDRSGLGNHAFYSANTFGTNTWPTPITGPSNLNAAYFYASNGQGAAIWAPTNTASPLAVFTKGTWALWVYMDGEMTEDAVWLTTGNELNNWCFGKYYGNTAMFYRATTTEGQEPMQVYACFPTFYPTAELDKTWRHYAVTWDGTNFLTYLNGSLFTNNEAELAEHHATKYASGTMTYTNIYTGVLASTNETPANSYIGLGWNTHSWVPADANNGFHFGGLADVRIYNRALSAEEVAAIYGGTATNGVPDVTPPPATNGAPRHLRVRGSMRAGQVRGP